MHPSHALAALLTVIPGAASAPASANAAAVAAAAPAQPQAAAAADDPWKRHMLAAGYPQNEAICKQFAAPDMQNPTWTSSKADDYYHSWMVDHNGDMKNWVQKMHLNATADSGIGPSDLDCTLFHTGNCQPPSDGDCERYNPAAFRVIQSESVNLYNILQAMDISSIKQTLLTSLQLGGLIQDFMGSSNQAEQSKKLQVASGVFWLISGVFGILGLLVAGGANIGINQFASERTLLFTMGSAEFVTNSIGAILAISSQAVQHQLVDPDALEAAMTAALGGFFDAISQNSAALAAKIFGGAPRADVDLAAFVSGIDKAYRPAPDTLPYQHVQRLFELQKTVHPTNTDQIVTPMFQAGFDAMKLGFIAYLLSRRKFYVIFFPKSTRALARTASTGLPHYMDNGCYVLRAGDRCFNHGDNAASELGLAIYKYGLDPGRFFSSVRACGNDAALINGQPARTYSMGDLGDMARCFFPLHFLTAPNPDTPWEMDAGIAKQLGIRYQTSERDWLHCWW